MTLTLKVANGQVVDVSIGKVRETVAVCEHCKYEIHQPKLLHQAHPQEPEVCPKKSRGGAGEDHGTHAHRKQFEFVFKY